MSLPIKINFKTEIVLWLIIVLSFGLALYGYQNLPDQIASHWNFRGEVDGYASKTFGAWFGPILLIGMYALFIILPYFDPQKKRYEEFATTYNIFRFIIIFFFFLIYAATLLFNLGYPLDIGKLIPALIGILFIIMGNYLGKIKFNWFMGIRTPWTMSSENVWNKTHRYGGWLFVALGIVIILDPFLPETLGLITFIAAIVAMILGTFGMSYYFYRKEKQ